MATNTWPGGLTQLLIPPTAPKAGTKISDGLPPVPEKLVAKIRRGEFVELHELLPECLAESTDSTGPIPRSRARKRLNDISVWLQCFALYVGVLASSKPALVPDLMAYMISIIRASQEFEGSAWTVYDDAYRRQAAAAGDQWQWSQVNPSLYTICFTGKAKRTGRCERCLSAAHKREECSLLSEDDPDMAKRLKTIEAAVMALTQSSSSSVPRGQSGEMCRKYNRGSAPSATASTGTSVPLVGETIQQWSALQRPRGEREPPRPNAQGHATEATADRCTVLTTASTHLRHSKLVVRLYMYAYIYLRCLAMT